MVVSSEKICTLAAFLWFGQCFLRRGEHESTFDAYEGWPARYRVYVAHLLRFLTRSILGADYDFGPIPSGTENGCLYCYHPHGAWPFAAINMASFHALSEKHMKERHHFIGVIPFMFYMPIIRMILLWGECRSSSKTFLEKALVKRQGVMVYPGGVREQANTYPDDEKTILPPNLGFIRMAIQKGKPLLPVYSFGESRVFAIPSFGPRLSDWVYKSSGLGVPVGCPRGPFGTTQVHVRFGHIVDTSPQSDNPTEEHVMRVLLTYIRELRHLFEANLHLLPATAKKELRIFWRGRLLEGVHELHDLTGLRARL